MLDIDRILEEEEEFGINNLYKGGIRKYMKEKL